MKEQIGGERIFIIRNRTEDDYLTPSLLQLDKKLKRRDMIEIYREKKVM